MKGSWKTTTFGLMAAIGYSVALVDGIPHWLLVVARVCEAAGLAGIGFVARDNNKTSEQVGAAPKPPPQSVGKLPLPLSCLLLAFGLALGTGCATTNAPGRLLVTATQTVDAAMQGWAAYVQTGQATDADQKAVRDAYDKYQLLEQSAEKTYLVWIQTGDDSAWNRAAAALKASQAELLALVNRLHPPK